ncbi:hypothetical protein HZS_11, partial [Henneguya salminicola]
ASDEGLFILRQQGQVYIDGTFRVAPSTFSQCVVIMAFGASSNLTITCYWGLTTGKNEHIYCEILHNIFILLNYDWMPRICVIDLEMAILLKAVKYQSTETTIIGCNFYLRQAILRKMQKYGISAAERNSCMQFIGVLSGFKRRNLIILCEQETFAVVSRCSNLMAIALKSQLFQMDTQLIKTIYRVENDIELSYKNFSLACYCARAVHGESENVSFFSSFLIKLAHVFWACGEMVLRL